MMLQSRNPRRGVILLVVLALITLFASIGVAFVYFAEQEATKAQDQKAGETIKLPDADLLLNYVLKQLVYPTANTGSALYTQSLLENMYGRPRLGTAVPPNELLNTANIAAYNGTGWRSNLDTASGQDNLYRRNMQFQQYDEATHGSLNPTYTYPDHKNPYLGAVTANWRRVDYATHLPAALPAVPQGPVAIARSWAREMKFRIAVRDTASGTIVRWHEVILNPYSNEVFPSGVRHQAFWLNQPAIVMGNLPALAGGLEYVPNTSITCTTAGVNATLLITANGMPAHTLRPKPNNATGFNANFPPPGDNGGDVKNLPPEVKTLVGYDTTGAPIFANNDSYWMDMGFPAIPWSNNRKIKPLVAMFIKDNDGNVNLQTAGNVRGRGTGPAPATDHASAMGLGPWEINPRKLAIPVSELQARIGGRYDATTNPAVIRGTAGFTSALDGDPTTAVGSYTPTVPVYTPILRGAPDYSAYNLDGTYDGAGAVGYNLSLPWQLPGDFPIAATDKWFFRFPYLSAPVVPYNGFLSGNAGEFQRGVLNKSPLFLSPFAPLQVTSNADSAGANGTQRMFGLQNHELLYRASDTGADKISSELRKLMPTAYSSPQNRWQETCISNDLNYGGIAPWWHEATADYNLTVNPLTNGGTGPGRSIPAASAATGEFSPVANYLWRSKFGSNTRLDLARQLPDYPLPANNNTQLNLGDSLIRAQYMIALQARQRMASEIYNTLKDLMHPNADDAYRYLAQVAVNIVDYIDNDDYPTWFQVPDITTGTESTRIVWGTELPRLVLNEVYAEAVNNPSDPLPMNRAQMNYDVLHWVELYNPLNSSSYPGVWPYRTAGTPSALDAEARLNVGGTSVYRLVIAQNSTSAAKAQMRNNSNTMGYPLNPTDTQTKVVLFPANATVQASDGNYGDGQNTAGANGFYLVGPTLAPEGATTGAPMPATDPLNFPTPDLPSNNMVQSERITHEAGRFADSTDNRSAILLQRLANPYLPHNPINDPAVLLTGDAPVPNSPYNPYITIDYVNNIKPQHAVGRTDSGSTADHDPVENRHSYGKLQPYAGVNDITSGTDVAGVWAEQHPDRDYVAMGLQPLTAQPQHTFLRHNGVETDRRVAGPVGPQPNPQPNTGGVTYNNTMRLPFDWLVHLDRQPSSPVELLHVSGFKPHELTQQFNQLTLINGTTYTRISAPPPPPPPADLTPGCVVELSSAGWIGQDHGTPYSLKDNDLVHLTWVTPAGNISEWALATAVNHVTNRFQAVTNSTATGITAVQVRLVVPFAHYAPWYRALQNVDVQSSSRLYRLFEAVAVRNPGVDVGQLRFTSAVPPLAGTTNSFNISAPIDVTAEPGPSPGVYNRSRWIQLDHGAMSIGPVLPNLTTIDVPTPALPRSDVRVITTNDALMKLAAVDSLYSTGSLAAYNNSPGTNVGDTVVINAGVTTGNIQEQRATVLEVDPYNNRIRVVLSVPAASATTSMSEALTIDYTYVGGQQPGKININTVFDPETFRALVDAQAINNRYFYGPTAPIGSTDLFVDNVFTRIQQQRQPQYYYAPRMVGQSGQNGIVPEDRPFQGMASGDITQSLGIPQQGIGNTFLSDRYQEVNTGAVPTGTGRSTDMTAPVGGDMNDVHRFTRTLFEVGNPGQDHPQRRFEMLSKIWNNMTVRSNTFTIWMTIGFFEYNETTGLGAELGQIQGKNVRHRFFAVVDRTKIDSWLQSWALSDDTASINKFMDTSLFPSLDPRYETYTSQTAVSLPGGYVATSTLPALPGSAMTMPSTVQVTLASTNPFFATDNRDTTTHRGRLVYVTSDAGTEIAQISSQTATIINMQLTLPHSGLMTIRALPVPPTVLYWSQIK